jgi:hypothetical protein
MSDVILTGFCPRTKDSYAILIDRAQKFGMLIINDQFAQIACAKIFLIDRPSLNWARNYIVMPPRAKRIFSS